MRLRVPGLTWNRAQEMERNRQIEAADGENHKRGRDVEIGEARLILTSPNGTRYSVTVANDGTLSTTSL